MSLYKYRIESGQFVGQVDVADGWIVEAPNVWRKFKGQKLNALIYWLAKCNGSCSPVRMPNTADSEGERRFWEEGVKELKERGEP